MILSSIYHYDIILSDIDALKWSKNEPILQNI